MSKARLIIPAVILEGRSQAEVARSYGVSKGWVSKLVARYRDEGDTAFEPRSRAPRTSPNRTPAAAVEAIIQLRESLIAEGLDHGPDTIRWHLQQAGIQISAATISRHLARTGHITPAPQKRPKSSYLRFEAAMPNECWQSDFTHYRLADGTETEIITWLDDCTRYALHVTAHHRITTPIVLATFRAAITEHGPPAATLTDNGMVFTVRFAGHGRRGGRNAFEAELHRLGITQKNGRGSHPQTQGKVERFQQTLKKHLTTGQRPQTLAALQQRIDAFIDTYNHRRPHSSLPHRATPAARYQALPKATPTGTDENTWHARIRHDRVDKSGTVTLRIHSRLHHIGIGRTHARTHVILLIDDLHIRIVNAITGELLRELTIDTTRDYQPRGNQKTPEP